MRENAMVRLILLLALLLGMSSGRAIAGQPGPVCRLQTVVDVMARELSTRATYARLDPTVIEEEPTPDPRIVRCGVCFMTAFYNTALYGAQPVTRCEPRTFTVETVRNGYVVRSIR
jgi:hypothetical protein